MVDRKAVFAGVLLLFGLSFCAPAQRTKPGDALPTLIRGNERFAMRLLGQIHADQPDKNVVVAPLSLTIAFAALQANLDTGIARDELGRLFGWGSYPRLAVPSRMLLVAFEEPNATALRVRQRPGERMPIYPAEAAWLSNAVVYRWEGTIAERFIASGKKYFGLSFTSSGKERPTGRDVKRARPTSTTLPTVRPDNDVWITSGTHLQTAWAGNTFSMSKPSQAEFRTATGIVKSVEMLRSELSSYPYAKTDAFEAVALPGNAAYMLAVLPAEGMDIAALEQKLADVPDLVDSVLAPHAGTVTMPTFHLIAESKLRPSLEKLGIHQVFKDLGSMIKIEKSHLTEVNERVDIRVDQNGILADAEMIMGAVYGGIGGAREPFHVQLNRPFLFFVREQTTNALLFAGAVMDPTLQ